MDWHKRYKQMKSALKLTNADISDIIGNTADSIPQSHKKESGNFKLHALLCLLEYSLFVRLR